VEERIRTHQGRTPERQIERLGALAHNRVTSSTGTGSPGCVDSEADLNEESDMTDKHDSVRLNH